MFVLSFDCIYRRAGQSLNILSGKTMNNSSAIKVNSSIPSAEVCCLPLSHGSAIMVVIFAWLHSSTHQALSSPMLEYTIAAYFGHCWLDRNNDLRAFGCGNSREKSLSTRVCAKSWTRLLAFSQLCCSSSFMHLVAISTGRLLAVTFPLRHGRIMKNVTTAWKSCWLQCGLLLLHSPQFDSSSRKKLIT